MFGVGPVGWFCKSLNPVRLLEFSWMNSEKVKRCSGCGNEAVARAEGIDGCPQGRRQEAYDVGFVGVFE
jgi:hypothetical protein